MAEDKLWLHRRGENDIWQNLYEPYLIEEKFSMDKNELEEHPLFKKLEFDAKFLVYEGGSRQRLTHQLIETDFYLIRLPEVVKMPIDAGNWIGLSDIKKIAFPKTLVSFLEKKLYF